MDKLVRIKHLTSQLFFITTFSFSTLASAATVPIFINELHYDNVGGDTNEFIEIAAPAGTNFLNWSLVLYNGNNSSPYDTIQLSGITPNQQNGFGTVFFNTNSMQNGTADGIALVDDTDSVIQFISYEGVLTAVDGPAAGLTSEDILLAESTLTPSGFSLQLQGSGISYEQFSWQSGSESWGEINATQMFAPSPVPLPATLPLFASSILLTAFLKRRRSRQ